MLNDVSASTNPDGPAPTGKGARRLPLVLAIALAAAFGGATEVARANLEGISDHDFVIDWANPTKGIDTGVEVVDSDDETTFGVRLLEKEFSIPVAEPLESPSQARPANAEPIIPAATAPSRVSQRQSQRFGFNARFFTMGDFEYTQARRLMPAIQESSGNPAELTEEHSLRVFRFAF